MDISWLEDIYDSSLTGRKATDDLSLPKATIQKIITEILGDKAGLTFGKDARDLLIDCSVEFVTMVSSQANEIAEQEAKKTIATEHVDKALRELGFPEYVNEVLAVAGEHKEQLKVSLTNLLFSTSPGEAPLGCSVSQTCRVDEC